MGHIKQKTYIDMLPLWELPSIFKVCLTDRSDGKSTGAEVIAVKSFDLTGKRPIWCRRTWTEYEGEFAENFLGNLYDYDKAHPSENLINGRKFEIKGSTKKHTLAFYIDGVKAINFEALTTAIRRKSSYGRSGNLHIFVDEYIPLDGAYLKNEVIRILELYKTIDRKNYDNKILVTGNKVTMSNPVFTFFKIKTVKNDKLVNLREDTLTYFVWSSKNNVEQEKQSKFGALTAGTEYGGYNSGGFMQDLTPYLCEQHSKSFVAYITHRGRLYALYTAKNSDIHVIDYARTDCPQDANKPLVCLEPQDNTRAIMLKGYPNLRDFMRNLHHNNKLKFASAIIMDELFEIWRQTA